MVEKFLIQVRHLRAALQEAAEAVDELERDLEGSKGGLRTFNAMLDGVESWEDLVEVLRELPRLGNE